jgi:hypothetical protein
MSQYTTYTVSGKNSNVVWEFKYYLNGLLYQFTLLEGELDDKQIRWLFKLGKFPYQENQIQDYQKSIKNLLIEQGDFDYSFEAWYNYYDYKQGKRKMAINSFGRLSKGDVVLLWKGTERYKHFMKYNPQRDYQSASTFINQESYLNEWNVN